MRTVGAIEIVGVCVGGSKSVGVAVVGGGRLGGSVGKYVGLGVGSGGRRKVFATLSLLRMRWKVSFRSRLLWGWTTVVPNPRHGGV